MRIDTENPVPIFQQIVDRLSAAVAAGVYGEGELVPSVRQMAVNLLVNPNTVQRAYEQLERDGILVGRRGSGMAVAAGAKALASATSAAGVAGTFARGIDGGRSARMSRASIDRLYRQAWEEQAAKPSHASVPVIPASEMKPSGQPRAAVARKANG